MLSALEVPLPVSTGGGVLCPVRAAFLGQLSGWRYLLCRAARQICCSMMLCVRSSSRAGRSSCRDRRGFADQNLGKSRQKDRLTGTRIRPGNCSLSATRVAAALWGARLARALTFLPVGADVFRPRASRSALINTSNFNDFASTADVFRVLQGNFCFSKDLENCQEKITFPLAPSVCPQKTSATSAAPRHGDRTPSRPETC
jgi:hypothetical protein